MRANLFTRSFGYLGLLYLTELCVNTSVFEILCYVSINFVPTNLYDRSFGYLGLLLFDLFVYSCVFRILCLQMDSWTTVYLTVLCSPVCISEALDF